MQDWRRSAVYGSLRHRFVSLAVCLTFAAGEARADAISRLDIFGDLRNSRDAVLLSIFVGLVLFATTVSILHILIRRRMQQRENALASALNETRAKLDRAETFLAAEPQITIVWGLQGNDPEIEGDITLVSDAPIARRVLGFGSWLTPEQAQALETAVASLRERGEPFASRSSASTDVTSRPRDVPSPVARSCASVKSLATASRRRGCAKAWRGRCDDLDMFKGLLDCDPLPGLDARRPRTTGLGQQSLCPRRRGEGPDGCDVATGSSLLESPTREASDRQSASGCRSTAAGPRPCWPAGGAASISSRSRTSNAPSGIAFDVSDLEAARIDLQQLTTRARAHAGPALHRGGHFRPPQTARVPQFRLSAALGASTRPSWNRPPANPKSSIDCGPGACCPEQADFRAWKDDASGELPVAGHHGAGLVPPRWSNVANAVINPNPQSGVTYLFDDVTAHFHLESQFNAQTRVQRETLDTLKEGVAGVRHGWTAETIQRRVSRTLWKLDAVDLDDKPHIDKVAALCTRLSPDAEPWAALRTAVAGLHDHSARELNCACRAGTARSWTAPPAPLPDGATLLTFTDTTASVNVERAVDRSQPGPARDGAVAQRLRPSCQLRTTLAADQYHRLHSAPRRRLDWVAQSKTERICRLRDEILGGAARHHQRYSGSGDDRHRGAGTQA